MYIVLYIKCLILKVSCKPMYKQHTYYTVKYCLFFSNRADYDNI